MTTKTTGSLFDVSAHEGALWNYRTLTDDRARAAERTGEHRYEGFDAFARDVFHRMISETPRRNEHEHPVFAKLHSALDAIPEVADLRSRCIGEEDWAGLATRVLLDKVLGAVKPPESQIADPQGDLDAKAAIEALLADDLLPEQREALAVAAETYDETAADKRVAAQKAADEIDPSAIRRAARAGAAAANKEIDSALAMLEGLGVGTSATAGRVERRALAAKLASFVGDRERIKRIAEIAGRLRRVAAHKQAQKNQGIGYVAGVEQGRDLPRVLPQEVQLFMNPATSLLFLEKYNKRQLFQTKQENREPESKGPIVMCLDASWSMSGAPSEWGAAVALAFLDVARKQRRDFCLLHFNGAVIRCDRFDAKAPVDAAAALDMIAFNHANGGTSFRAALTGALEIIEAPGAFAKADVVFVTDGQGESDLTSLRERLKAREVSVYGVQVASASVSPSLAAICDEAVTVRETVDDAAIHNFFAKV